MLSDYFINLIHLESLSALNIVIRSALCIPRTLQLVAFKLHFKRFAQPHVCLTFKFQDSRLLLPPKHGALHNPRVLARARKYFSAAPIRCANSVPAVECICRRTTRLLCNSLLFAFLCTPQNRTHFRHKKKVRRRN